MEENPENIYEEPSNERHDSCMSEEEAKMISFYQVFVLARYDFTHFVLTSWFTSLRG